MFNASAALLKKQWLRLSTYSGSRRLSMFSLILLFGLDLYVLGLLFDGMQGASRTIEYPQLAISNSCQAMTADFLQQDAASKADSIKPYVTIGTGENQYDSQDFWMYASGFSEIEKLPVCGQVRDKLQSYDGNTTLGSLFLDYDHQSKRLSAIHSDIAELKSSYDSALLEKVARQKREDSILPAEATAIKGTIARKKADLAMQEKKLAGIRSAIENHALIQEYTAFVTGLPFAAEFATEHERFNQESFWYPVKVLAAEAIFLLPLLVLAIVWNLRAMKVQSHTQTLISSHLILVSAIPIFSRIVYFVYDLLPHRLLANIIAILESLNLGFLWNYVAIFGGIGACLVVIVIAQRTYFSPARQRSARLRKTLCRECGEKLRSANQAWCEFCGTNQLEVCEHCGKPHRLLAYHCEHCGGIPASVARTK